MKVILLQDIKKIGKKNDIVEVPDGQAKNFLIPKNLALEANNKNLNNLKAKKDSNNRKENDKLKKAELFKEIIEKNSITIKCKEKDGKLFGSITNQNISTELKRIGVDIEKKNIEIKNQISNIGSHLVKIKLHKNFFVEKEIIIVPE
tara:strand:+ start:841 stop:1281 length:441 start_codon:yes stop_codon:yes gene_type:complete